MSWADNAMRRHPDDDPVCECGHLWSQHGDGRTCDGHACFRCECGGFTAPVEKSRGHVVLIDGHEVEIEYRAFLIQ